MRDARKGSLAFLLKYTLVVFKHRIKADSESCDKSGYKKNCADKRENLNIGIECHGRENAERNYRRTYNDCPESDLSSEWKPVLLRNAPSVVVMERRNVTAHIHNAEYYTYNPDGKCNNVGCHIRLILLFLG